MQKKLASKVIADGGPKNVRLVAGADVHPEKETGLMKAVVCVLSFPGMELIEWKSARVKPSFPYVPGLLSFREGPAIIDCFEKLRSAPDVAMFDGHGLSHPRRFGLACHMGLLLGIPSIGCAKSPLFGSCGEPGPHKGDRSPILDDQRNLIGTCLRTRDGVAPLYVSAGHLISPERAVELALDCTGKYRIPEPLRMAHRLAKHGPLVR